MVDYISILLLLFLSVIWYLYLTKNSSYWKSRKVPFIPPLPILGNLEPLIFLRRSPGQFVGDLYNAPEAIGQKFLGIFIFNSEPALLVRDPELISHILVKDSQYFPSRTVECVEKCDPVGVYNLFVIRGLQWRFLRSKLMPAFSSQKIKQMFHLVKESGNELLSFMESSMENGMKKNMEKSKPSLIIEAKGIIARLTVDIISICAFGIKSNSISNENSQFRVFAHKIFDMTIKRSLEVRSFFFMKWMAKTFNFYFLQKESTEFFRKVFDETIKERENNKIVRNDFLDVLLKTRNDQKQNVGNNGEEILKLEGDVLLAQPILFFTAGFETTSSVISFALYELALQPHLQERLRVEIVNNLKANGGELTYESLFEMKYLDAVVSETLRKYPPMPFVDRICAMDYKIPGTDVIIRKGTSVFISLYKGLHYDEKYYPMSEKFDPERFTEENKKTRHSFTYIPFGEGPHICIGKRFALMNIKTTLSLILSTYKVEMCENTEIPLEMSNRSIVLSSKNGNYLKFVKL